ncbi:hydroxymethylpyrimidine/phosphomethylpyrimidine kinase, partial [Microbacteriaceae bacterium K1510]|nr:hydroxymethylpyrimidine/phosphomethylpyrimidine kinase [Microbacteriaceae bacterium K1510]
PEAARLLSTSIAKSEAEMEAQARALLSLGPKAVLVKGGHGDSADAVDILVVAYAPAMRFAQPRVVTRNTHGTGCTLSAAIAAYLARGEPLAEATSLAKQFVHAALLAGVEMRIGSGAGPVDHLHAIERPRKS